MPNDDLIPLKQVEGALGVSHSTFWRARRSVKGFPEPVEIQGRKFWPKSDLPAMRDALLRYRGRIVFECQRRFEQLCAQKTAASKRRRPKAGAKSDHPDLFLWADKAGPRNAW
jgi:predicted DNA-binding transcriptional regulator AlpA